MRPSSGGMKRRAKRGVTWADDEISAASSGGARFSARKPSKSAVGVEDRNPRNGNSRFRGGGRISIMLFPGRGVSPGGDFEAWRGGIFR
jgi:hypothetical protein